MGCFFGTFRFCFFLMFAVINSQNPDSYDPTRNFVVNVQDQFCDAWSDISVNTDDVCEFTKPNAVLFAKLSTAPPEQPSTTCCKPCSCNPDCVKTDTCCPSLLKKASVISTRTTCGRSQLRPHGEHYPNKYKDYLMLKGCSVSYDALGKDEPIRNMCEDAEEYNTLETKVPVTDLTTMAIYINRYCALCNDVLEENIVRWIPSIRCIGHSLRPSDMENIVDEVRESLECNILYNAPHNVDDKTCMRYMSSCNITGKWTSYDAVVKAACEAYSSPYNFEYRNLFCYICNTDEEVGPAECKQKGTSPPDGGTVMVSFSAILRFKPDGKAPQEIGTGPQGCNANQIYDEFMEVCRNISCFPPRVLINETCTNLYESISGESYRFYIKLVPLTTLEPSEIMDLPTAIIEYMDNSRKQLSLPVTGQTTSVFIKEKSPIQPEYYLCQLDVSIHPRVYISPNFIDQLLQIDNTDVSVITRLGYAIALHASFIMVKPRYFAESNALLYDTIQDELLRKVYEQIHIHDENVMPEDQIPIYDDGVASEEHSHINNDGVALGEQSHINDDGVALEKLSPIHDDGVALEEQSHNNDFGDPMAEQFPINDFGGPPEEHNPIHDGGGLTEGELPIYDDDESPIYDNGENPIYDDSGLTEGELPILDEGGELMEQSILDDGDFAPRERNPIYDDDGMSEEQNQVVIPSHICPLVVLSSSEFQINWYKWGVYVKQLETNISRQKYAYSHFLARNESILVCKSFYQNVTRILLLKYPKAKRITHLGVPPRGLMSLVCSCLSVLCSVFTLITYILFCELRTQPGMNNVMLTCSLICAQILFQFGIGQAKNVPDWFCTTLGILVHFSWLVTLMWMNVCSLHMFKVFRSLRQISNSSCIVKTTLKYTTYVIAMASIPIVINIAISQYFDDSFGYGGLMCYITSYKMVGYLFALPVGLIVVVNMSLFVGVIITISKLPKIDGNTSINRNFAKIYIKISTLTGLFWIFGFVFAFTELEVLEYVFIILNAGLGVFMFLSFVCNTRVLALYSRTIRSTNKSTFIEPVKPSTSDSRDELKLRA